MKNVPAIVAVIALVAGVAYWQWHRTNNDGARVEQVAKPVSLAVYVREANAKLPQPFEDGFEMRRVHVDGRRLVTDIVSTEFSVADLDPAKIPQIHDQERQDMVAATCGDPTLLSLMHGGTTIVRRFLDKQGKPIFDVEVTPRFCGRMTN